MLTSDEVAHSIKNAHKKRKPTRTAYSGWVKGKKERSIPALGTGYDGREFRPPGVRVMRCP